MKNWKHLAAITLMLAGTAHAVTVSLGTYVCNPGASVRIPVAIDNARGLVGVSVTLAYDPQVAVCSRVEPGSIESVLDDDFLTSNDGNGAVSAAIFKLGENVAEDIGGTVATFVFIARPGTAGQFSDITVTKVELLEKSGVRDATVDNPVTTVNGMIRVMATDAAVARMEGAQTVVADTRLGSLALADGDGIQASDSGTPIVVDGAVEAAGAAIPVSAPDRNWATMVYTLLKTPTAGLTFANATNASERLEVVETRSGGISTYTLAMAVAGGFAIISDEQLDASQEAYVRECVGLREDLSIVRVTGGAQAVSMASAFGIRPALSSSGSEALAEYLMPTVRVTGFSPAAGTIIAVIEPGHGNSIAGSGTVTGVIEVLGANKLGDAMIPVDSVEIDLDGYFNAQTKGKVRCTANFGGNRFFRVRISDKRTGSQSY